MHDLWRRAAIEVVQAAAAKLADNLGDMDEGAPAFTPLVLLHATPGHEEVSGPGLPGTRHG